MCLGCSSNANPDVSQLLVSKSESSFVFQENSRSFWRYKTVNHIFWSIQNQKLIYHTDHFEFRNAT